MVLTLANSLPTYIDQWGIDPDLFFDDDGQVHVSSAFGADSFGYNSTGYFSIWTSQLSLSTGDSITPTTLNLVSSLALDTPRLAEGAHIYKIDGSWYMFTAEAGTAYVHREMAYRSKEGPYGPWEASPTNPLVFNGRESYGCSKNRLILMTFYQEIYRSLYYPPDTPILYKHLTGNGGLSF